MTKKKIRNKYNLERLALNAEKIKESSASIDHYLKQLDIPQNSFLHIYLPIISKNEFDTYNYIDWLKTNRADVRIVLSKSSLVSNKMVHYLLEDTTTILHNKWNIPEPEINEYSTQVDSSQIDFVIIPLLVCDMLGNRVGYGKGYYDRFLSDCQICTQKIGISFFNPLITFIYSDPWDIPLDKCVTPSGITIFDQYKTKK